MKEDKIIKSINGEGYDNFWISILIGIVLSGIVLICLFA